MNFLRPLLVFASNRKAAVGTAILLAFILIAFFAPLLAPFNPEAMSFKPQQLPTWKHLLGTTSTGQDIFSQVIWGTRSSLFVGLFTGIIASILSVIVGLVAGYFGGTVDDVLMMITNIFLVLPGLVLIIIISSFVIVKNMWTIILVISITGWAWGARVLRSQMMTLKSRDFVSASLITGERPSYIIFADILPNMAGLIAANFFGAALYAVLSEAGLEFLGLGNSNAISWGVMLYWAQNNQAILFGLWLWMAVPGIMIALLGMAFALMNFAVDELTNPRLRTRKE